MAVFLCETVPKSVAGAGSYVQRDGEKLPSVNAAGLTLDPVWRKGHETPVIH